MHTEKCTNLNLIENLISQKEAFRIGGNTCKSFFDIHMNLEIVLVKLKKLQIRVSDIEIVFFYNFFIYS